MELKKELEKLKPELIALRRDFHRYPELGFKEFRTQEKIIAYLDNSDNSPYCPGQKYRSGNVK